VSKLENKKKISDKKFKVIVSLCLVGIVVLCFFCGFFVGRLLYGKKADSLAWIINLIEDEYYYDEGEGVIKGFTTEEYANALVKQLLDKYSGYYTSEEYADVVSTGKGNAFGTGLSFLNADDTTTVFRVSLNSPAEKSGLRSGDVLKRGVVDGQTTEFTTKDKMKDFLENRVEGETFTLFVERGGTELEFTTAKKVYVQSYVYYLDSEKTLKFESEGNAPLVKTEYDEGDNRFDNDTAYLKLVSFEGGAGSQVGLAMDYMKQRGRTKLILDLCDNGGGYMTVLSEVTSYLTYQDGEGKPVIAVAEDKKGKKEYFKSAGDNFNREIQKITVLANQNTASASECLIGAMLYYGKAFSIDNLVVPITDGEARTYGKGIMQTTYQNFWTGEALKLTTALVYQPDGTTCINGRGISAKTENQTIDYDSAIQRAIAILQG